MDVNDFRAIPGWKYVLSVKRGHLIGWTDKDNNIAGHSVPFPLIHMGDFEHRDRAFTLWHFPFLTAGQIIGGGAPDAAGKLVLPAREAVIKDYDLMVELPHAAVYAEK
ncbi:MAG: hypothetical protein HGB17_15550 [Syntrophobacteraceae bacterium]|nr:hypothetical protein [Syntrophobacteraceae bacterium]